MSKWYEIAVSIHRTYAVEVKDDETEEDAKKALADELCGEDYTGDDAFGPVDDENGVRNMQIMAYDSLRL